MPKSLPIVPMRNGVLFPGVSLPITAARPQTLRAIEAAIRDPEHKVFVVAQRSDVDEVTADGLYTIGTIAAITSVERGLGGMRVALEGQERGIAMRVVLNDGYLVATVSEGAELPPLDARDPTFVALHREVRERAAELAIRRGVSAEAVGQMLKQITEPGQLADLVAGYLDAPVAERQGLLEALAVEDRLRRVLLMVQRQIEVLSAQEHIQSKVKEELGERQREVYLREQLRAIQKELGEGEGAADEALAGLKAKLDKLPLPDDARREVDREWGRLSRIGRESMESQVIRTYLETVAELPWGTRTEEHLDVAEAARILDEDHHGLRDVKDRVLEFLAVHQLAQGKARKGRILLFSGPPGVGKTSIAKSIARAMGRKYVRIALGGARDEADIRGHRRTYIGALPGRILAGMKQAGSKNPVFLLDEVDKLGVSYQGDPASALLEVLDPAQNDSFTDHYLGVPFDLSEVMFIATANFLQNIPAPLLDRMEVVDFAGYTEREKLAIARDYLLPRQLDENGLTAEELDVTDAAIADVITSYTRESGVRQLERELGRLARKVTRRIAAREIERAVVERGDVRGLLGRPRVHPEHAAREDQVGIATGMYYTPAGGDIMFVEASPMRGKGELILTGQLGDVMKESARAAWTFARAHADWLSIDDRVFERDIHVHVPAGAIPKDGPSAGIAMATAIVSALSGRPARHDVAMTGEITLSGRVLPIGGLKEKVLGAVRAGITHIVIPRDNAADLEDLPSDVRDGLEVSPVDTLAEALAVTLGDASLREGRLAFGEPRRTDEPRLAH
ncbi:MAG: endopeptidase La [Deltaproteobacteria bacterium]|nr:MAG: endopeptidase La [Deltaproteobacteria bacterium]TMQ21385.1 MAG: endopeptidase La [Deltaproteobacteria bacterium]